MGKKSKLFKSGLSKNIIKKSIYEQKIEYEPIVSYNKMKFDKANETLGLDEKDINDLLNHPMRNRRNVHNKTLTKREKKKIEREERKERLKNLK